MITNAADALREERCREVGMEAAKRFLDPNPVVDLRCKGGSCRAGATLGGGQAPIRGEQIDERRRTHGWSIALTHGI